MKNPEKAKLAVWCLTLNGAILAGKILHQMPDVCVYVSRRIEGQFSQYQMVDNLAESIKREFHRYAGHVFMMSTGIVVRLIAALIKHKTVDPAVVVVDDGGQHAISLLSGHLGGANDLTHQIADIIGAQPVITTATDVNQLPAIDILAKEKKLFIENPVAIKFVNMAILEGLTIWIHDPYHFLAGHLPNTMARDFGELAKTAKICHHGPAIDDITGVFIDDVVIDLPPQVLVLRPASLVAGIGCNRNTESAEIKNLLTAASRQANLSLSSLKCLASIDVKADEAGLIALSHELHLPLIFFKRRQLEQVKNIQNPSALVEKHVGVKSVCEAAAILAAQNGTLIVPKQTTRNATVAIARTGYTWLESAPAVPNI